MRSLRARLTLSYALLTAIPLCIVVVALTYLSLEFLTHSMSQAVEESANKARAIVAAAGPDVPTGAVQAQVARDAATAGVVIFAPPRMAGVFLGMPPGLGPGAPPGGDGPLTLSWPISGSSSVVFHARAIERGIDGGGITFSSGPGLFPAPLAPGAGQVRMAIRSGADGEPVASWWEALPFVKPLLAIREEFVPINESGVIIAPDMRRIDQAITTYTQGLGVALILAVFVSWFIGRWTTVQAISPLTRVTEELRRFAAGDFTPRSLTTRDRTELGDLIEAYNGAAAQVSAAFAERARVEAHMRRFIADAGHELRTPLTAVSGFVEVLERSGDNGAAAATRTRVLPTMKKEAQRMQALVERLIALSRLEGLEAVAPAEIELGELVGDAIAALRGCRSGTVTVRHAEELRVLVDESSIYEAISNLIENALKYGGGSDVLVDIVGEGEQAVVRVTDAGPGIDEADRGRIFERFYRGENRQSVEGSGLGLAIAARAAERAGGTVELESAEPGATVFALKLPAQRKTMR